MSETHPGLAASPSGPQITGSGRPEPDPPEDHITSAPAATPQPVKRLGDRTFQGLASGSSALITVIIGAIAVFLVWRAVPALSRNQVSFLTSRVWNTSDSSNLSFGVFDLLIVTIVVSLAALVIAMPVSLGIALFITQYAHDRVAKIFSYLIDLLAAVPSVVYGLWGLAVFGPALQPVAEWLNRYFSFIPLFANPSSGGIGARTIFTAAIVLAIMIVPIITAVSREVFVQTPRTNIEAALALGATRWEVIRVAVLPFGRSGFISGSMLGLGRALGETMALYIILATMSSNFSWTLFDGGSTIASKIALGYAEFTDNVQAGAYIAAGLVLFVLTFAVNAGARAVVSRSGAKA